MNTSITLADLAGSECLEKTKTKGKNTREGSMINKSLLALSTVISKLSRREEFVGYRESKLTRILQPALTGNVMVSVICTVNPLRPNLQESINTLKFGTCAGVIKKKLDIQQEKQTMDSKLAREVIAELEEMSVRLNQANETIGDREQALELCQISVEELRTALSLAENEKNFFAKDNNRLQEEVRALLGDNSRLLVQLEETEARIIQQKENEFKFMFDQQSLLIKNLEDEIDHLKSQREENYREAIKQRDVIACMRKNENSVKNAKVEGGSSSSAKEEVQAPVERLSRPGTDYFEKLRVELDAVKVKLVNSQKELIKQEKVNRQLRLENDALRKEIEENNVMANRPRKAIKAFVPQSMFDRNGDPILKKVAASPTKDELKVVCKQLEKRAKQLENQRDQSLSREEKCRFL